MIVRCSQRQANPSIYDSLPWYGHVPLACKCGLPKWQFYTLCATCEIRTHL